MMLVGFPEASKKGYAGVVYLRTIEAERNEVTLVLVATKTRVAPLVEQSFPLLELIFKSVVLQIARDTSPLTVEVYFAWRNFREFRES